MAAQKARQGVAAVRSRGMTTTPRLVFSTTKRKLDEKTKYRISSYHVERGFGKPGKRMGRAGRSFNDLSREE
jgi:hypothetical protein